MTGFLLDTHALIWWFESDTALPPSARSAVGERTHTIYASAVSAFEIATKHRIGKLPGVRALLEEYGPLLAGQGFVPLPITEGHALAAGLLPFGHRDPFDRLLIAQALEEDLTLVSNERLFDGTGVRRVWD